MPTPPLKQKRLGPSPTDSITNLLQAKLLHLQRSQLLTDGTISCQTHTYNCHVSYLSAISTLLKLKFQVSPDITLTLPPSVSSYESLFAVFDWFYGEPLIHNDETNIIVNQLQICTYLRGPFPKFKIFKAISTIKTDVTIQFKSSSIQASSLFLIVFSKSFLNLMTGNWEDSNTREFHYESQFPGVLEDNFRQFFQFLKCPAWKPSQALDLFQLSVYFEVEFLILQSKQLLAQCHPQVAKSLLVMAVERNQFLFLNENIELFSELKFSEEDVPIILTSSMVELFISHLYSKHTSNFYWLLRCAVKGYDSPGQFVCKIILAMELNIKILRKVFILISALLETHPVDMLLVSLDVLYSVRVNSVPHPWLIWVFLQFCLHSFTEREWVPFYRDLEIYCVKRVQVFKLHWCL
ncbi:hypothetical protein GEMRC1_002311 [Eukaryota sp. GEM-RC1]